jgi:hypothetical protein
LIIEMILIQTFKKKTKIFIINFPNILRNCLNNKIIIFITHVSTLYNMVYV